MQANYEILSIEMRFYLHIYYLKKKLSQTASEKNYKNELHYVLNLKYFKIFMVFYQIKQYSYDVIVPFKKYL